MEYIVETQQGRFILHSQVEATRLFVTSEGDRNLYSRQQKVVEIIEGVLVIHNVCSEFLLNRINRDLHEYSPLLSFDILDIPCKYLRFHFLFFSRKVVVRIDTKEIENIQALQKDLLFQIANNHTDSIVFKYDVRSQFLEHTFPQVVHEFSEEISPAFELIK